MTHTHVYGALLGLALAAGLACPGMAAAQEEGTARQRAELEQKAKTLLRQSGKLHEQGQLEQATEVARQALDLCRQLYPEEKYPGGSPDLAASLNNLGFLMQARGAYDRA